MYLCTFFVAGSALVLSFLRALGNQGVHQISRSYRCETNCFKSVLNVALLVESGLLSTIIYLSAYFVFEKIVYLM